MQVYVYSCDSLYLYIMFLYLYVQFCFLIMCYKYTGCPFNLVNFQIAVTLILFGIFSNLSNQNMNFLLYTIKIHNSNTKKCANSVIKFEPYSNIVFSKEVQICIVQNYSSKKGLTQLRRDYIVNHFFVYHY